MAGCGWLRRGPAQDGVSRAEVWGLALGQSTPDDVAAWAAARGLSCETQPSPRRQTTRMECRDGLTPAVLPGRTVNGRVADLLVAWPDGGRVHHVSAWRRYSVPADALVDYRTAVEAINARLGPPTRAMDAPEVSALDAKMFRFGAAWSREDLDVRLELTRLGADYVSVSETWTVPGVEAEVGARTSWGSSGATKADGDAHP